MVRQIIRVLATLGIFSTATLFLSADPVHAQSHPGDADLITIDGGPAQLTVMGLLQTQITPYAGTDSLLENGDPADRAGIRIRRARLGFTGTLWGNYDFELSMETTASGVNLLDAYLGWHPTSDIYVVAGARKVPFSRYAMTSAGDGALNTRPLGVRAMAPSRQLGLTIEGNVGQGIFRYYAGVYNGFARQGSFHEGISSPNPMSGNRFTNLAYAARVDIAFLGGVSHGIADLDQGDLSIGLGGAFYYDDGTSLQSWGAEGDLLLKVKGLHLLAELIVDSAEPAAAPTSAGGALEQVDRSSFTAELGYVILPEQFGITARAELIDPNTAVDDNLDQFVLTAGFQYYVKRQHLKVGLDFTHRGEKFGKTLDNDSLMLQLQMQL